MPVAPGLQEKGGLALLGAVELLEVVVHTEQQVAPPGLQKVASLGVARVRAVAVAKVASLGVAKVLPEAVAKGLAKVRAKVAHRVPRANGLRTGPRLIPARFNFAGTITFEALVLMAQTAPGVTSAPISP